MRDLNEEIDGGEFLLNVFKWIFYIVLFWGIFYGYFVIYNPKKQNYIKKSNLAYQLIQKEVTELYKQQGYIYSSLEDKNDALCNIMNQKNSKGGGSCLETNTFVYSKNFTINKTKIDILGMEKAPYLYEGMLVKDIIIDVDGENKGENQFGVDRVPLRIYSNDRMAGRISPVSCSMTTTKDWEVPYPDVCKGAPEIDFNQTNEPFGYDIIQIGGDTGKSQLLGRNLPFFRADCVAFGGELMAPIGYCDQRQYYWLPACYDEYPCSVEISTSKF